MTKLGTEKPEAHRGDDPAAPARAPARAPRKTRKGAERLVVRDPGLPRPEGLYDPGKEKDACGVGFVGDLKNRKSHAIVEQGLAVLKNLAHRGAVGADPMMGDGCGILVQIPHRFFLEECASIGIALPEAGLYGVGQLFMPRDPEGFRIVEELIAKAIADEGLTLLGWRDVPVASTTIGASVRATEPLHRQVFIGRSKSIADEAAF